MTGKALALTLLALAVPARLLLRRPPRDVALPPPRRLLLEARAGAGRPPGPPWREVPGLSRREAEELLDRLEREGVAERELGPVRPTGFTVRYR